jgi:hypothetical protein
VRARSLPACGVVAGLRWVTRGEKGGTWGPILLGVYGAALVASGLFPVPVPAPVRSGNHWWIGTRLTAGKEAQR